MRHEVDAINVSLEVYRVIQEVFLQARQAKGFKIPHWFSTTGPQISFLHCPCQTEVTEIQLYRPVLLSFQSCSELGHTRPRLCARLYFVL